MNYAKTKRSYVSLSAHLAHAALVIFVVVNSPGTASAAIILQKSAGTLLPQGNLVQYIISAVGTQGETIDTFSNPAITGVDGGMGVHNVGQAFTNAGTATRAEHMPGLWSAEWAPYDTYFLFDSTQTLSFGGVYTETNNGATTGMLGLPRLAGQPTDPMSGFGEYNFTTTSASKWLTPASGQADSEVPFLQVVMRPQDSALLSIRVVGNNLVGDFTGANAYQIGPVPEPSTIALLAVPAIGLLASRRVARRSNH